ncbi:GSCOCG00011101001-RA-CDS [Cotesia congregata]|uniref:Globin domain-containing protein n=1 Tax=Cotesia congregata TaxID=51543 RepID=A0A8J2HA96_COTCN|nr:GSCOCG00011101001-RA-CDS [Cotesia congregata]CAG5088754.1 Protein of unknown function [Cotesia congregata]
MSHLFSDNISPADSEKIGPRISGFTQKQKKYMKNTWDEFVFKNLTAIGAEAMMSVFENNNDIKEMFPAFKKIPIDQLKHNEKFNAHCKMIMNVLNKALNAFFDDNDELFEKIVKIIGERHAMWAKNPIIIKQFQCVQVPLIDSLKIRLESQWTEETANLWTYAVEKVFRAMIVPMKEVFL